MFNSRFFSFSTIGHNDRGYGHGRVAGLSTCRQAEQLARAQSHQIPRQPACEHRRVLGGRSLLFFSRLNFGRLVSFHFENHNSVAC